MANETAATDGPHPHWMPSAIERWVGADRRQDAVTMREQLSPDVVLISPLTDGFDFRGPDEVIAVFESAFDLLTDIEITAVTGADRDWAVHGTNRLDGRNLEEIQWHHLDDDGLIDRITLFIRPAPAAIALLSKIGVRLNKRGALDRRAALASRASAPLAWILGLVESTVMPRLRRRD